MPKKDASSGKARQCDQAKKKAAKPPAKPAPVAPQPGAKRRRTYREMRERRPIELVLSRLKNVSISGDQWSARCPGHLDRRNSLSVAEAEDGKVLIFCHAGCDLDDVLMALDLSMRDLFDRRRRRRSMRYPQTEVR